ncbi:hypothetical protein E2C01_060348 [Portunus trituberculatus]|uniref:Uncharacterized protein n=1 Tax=Portunus trituberculatus TaxID=210409 RepID=A0A5B7H500_PORTR|nr:hypothetical protein [Portunus trituberculatus]
MAASQSLRCEPKVRQGSHWICLMLHLDSFSLARQTFSVPSALRYAAPCFAQLSIVRHSEDQSCMLHSLVVAILPHVVSPSFSCSVSPSVPLPPPHLRR